jgi:Fe-S-cluster containining protein
MSCDFCNDWCCWLGADIDIENVSRLKQHAAELERYVGVSQDQWFDPDDVLEDEDAPGEFWWRTNGKSGKCVFLNRNGRGCMLHSFSLSKNMDYHELKPLVCAIFPLTFDEGLLIHADEVEDQELVCADQGLSLYAGVREELLYYFGPEFIEELDSLEILHR